MRGRPRHKWGPLPVAFVEAQKPAEHTSEVQKQGEDAGAATEPPAKRRRRSRWADRAAEEATGDDADKQIVLFPSEVVLSNGVKVVLPPAVTGRAPGGDPEVLELHRRVSSMLQLTVLRASWDRVSYEGGEHPESGFLGAVSPATAAPCLVHRCNTGAICSRQIRRFLSAVQRDQSQAG